MAEEFCARNIPACAVYSDSDGNFSEDRTAAIEKLEKGEISVIFSVDMFNEGVDIPSLDMVMFLRPTESPVVFLQQLGRGLRKAADKEYLTVLDFIGNYEKAGNAPFLLSGEPYSREAAEKKEQKDFDFPLDCVVDFDMRLIDLFKEMACRKETRRERIQGEYFRIKELLGGKVPTRMDLFTYMDEEIYQLCMKTPNENPFNHYLDFLGDLDQLTDKEWKLFQGTGKEFLHELETTSMSKSYKMPILLAFFNDGQVKMGITISSGRSRKVLRCSILIVSICSTSPLSLCSCSWLILKYLSRLAFSSACPKLSKASLAAYATAMGVFSSWVILLVKSLFISSSVFCFSNVRIRNQKENPKINRMMNEVISIPAI